MTAPAQTCHCCGQFDIGVQFVFVDLQHLLISLARGFKYFYDYELLYLSDEFQTNWIFHREHKIKKKQSLLLCGRHGKKFGFILCFSIKDQIFLKIVR